MLNLVKTRNKQSKLVRRVKPQYDATPTTLQALTYLFAVYRLLGVHMPLRNQFLYIIYSCIINGLVTIFLPLAFTVSYATLTEAETMNISSLLTSIQVAINVWGCSVKIIIMAFLLKKLLGANIVLQKLDERCRNADDEIVELHKMKKLGRNLVIGFACSYWSYATSTFLASVLRGRPPYSIYLPFINWHNSRLEFFIQSFIEFALMLVACTQQVVDDSYAVIYVCILRTHMRALVLRLQKLGTIKANNLNKNLEELKMCIKDHKHLLELYNIVAPVISITIFIQFMITAAILGTTLINMFIFSTEYSSIVASCFYVLAVVVEIFPLCYYSQCLVDDSNLLARQIFHSSWIEQSVQFRQLLIFFMQRTQCAMELTAGKIFPITLNSFLSIAKFSFSLYTFIKKMGIKERMELQ